MEYQTVEFFIGIGEGTVKEIYEFPTSFTDDDIEEEFKEWRAGKIDAGFNKIQQEKEAD